MLYVMLEAKDAQKNATFTQKSTIPDGRRRRRRRRPGLSQTKTNSAQAEAGARAELGKN